MASYWACWPRCGGINAADLAAIVPPGFHANIVGLGTAPFACLFGVTVSDRRSTRQAFLHDPRVPSRGLFHAGERWLALIYFVCCGVGRLARFNVTAEKLSEGSGKVAYFEGTPIPASVLLTGALAFAAWRGRLGPSLYWGTWTIGPWDLHPLALLFVLSGTLMISKTLRIPKL